MTPAPTPVGEVVAELGEGPRWDSDTAELVWVDIRGGFVHRTTPGTGVTSTLGAGPPVSLALPAGDGAMLAAIGQTLSLVDADGAAAPALASLSEPGSVRFNDGACDPAGRVWIGTMDEDRSPIGALYRLDGDALTAVVTGTTISNGLDWSPDASRLYFADTPVGRIDVFDYDAGAGELSDRRPFVQLAATGGRPDGLCVDAEGGVWVALIAIGQIHRYDAGGELSEVVELPVTHPTACAFGGAALDELFITTSWEQLDADARAAQPLAGRLFSVRPGAVGVAGRPHRPSLAAR